MPYFVYKIASKPSSTLKELEMQDSFEAFREAKNLARELRSGLEADGGITIKVMFAENATQAEEQLMRQREQPIMREWEK